jgi:hypothetical protein
MHRLMIVRGRRTQADPKCEVGAGTLHMGERSLRGVPMRL